MLQRRLGYWVWKGGVFAAFLCVIGVRAWQSI